MKTWIFYSLVMLMALSAYGQQNPQSDQELSAPPKSGDANGLEDLDERLMDSMLMIWDSLAAMEETAGKLGRYPSSPSAPPAPPPLNLEYHYLGQGKCEIINTTTSHLVDCRVHIGDRAVRNYKGTFERDAHWELHFPNPNTWKGEQTIRFSGERENAWQRQPQSWKVKDGVLIDNG